MTQSKVKRTGGMVAIRLTTAEMARLDALAHATERDRSKVVRWLLSQAQTTPNGGLVLGGHCEGQTEVRG